MAPCRKMEGRPRPGELVEGHCTNKGGLQRVRTRGAMRLEDSGDYPQGERCRLPWEWTGEGSMADNNLQLMIPDIAFHRTFTSPFPWKSAPLPLGIITTVFQVHGTSSSYPLKAAFISTMTFYQFPGPGSSSHFFCTVLHLKIFCLHP